MTIAGSVPTAEPPICVVAETVALRYDAAAMFEIKACAAVGFETLVTVIVVAAPAAIAALNPSVNTPAVGNVALLHPVGLLLHPQTPVQEKPVRVTSRTPPLGIATCGVRAIVMVTTVADLTAPGLLSVMAG